MEKWYNFKNSLNVKEYIKFWKNNNFQFFYINDFPWMKYQNILQPAILHGPYEVPGFTNNQIKKVLKESGCKFIRWNDNFKNEPTEWWWTICQRPFSIDLLSHNARNQIKKSLNNCEIKIIKPQELIEKGYQCYLSSCRNHKKTSFLNHKDWGKFINSHIKYNCFDFWGIFIDNKIIGYAKCVKINKLIDISAIWYDPFYLKYYPVYALTYSLLEYYLNKEKCYFVSNGMRSIAHDTQMQNFLKTKFHFKKEYCRLNVVYSPLFHFLIQIAYPFQSIIKFLDKIFSINIFHKIVVILKQEKIRRSFLNSSK